VAGTFDLTVHVQDQKSPNPQQSSRLYAIEIRNAGPTPLVITTVNIPNGTTNLGYDTPLSSQGGIGTPAWAVTGGALPPGLSLIAATGRISGTPTTAGTYSFVVTATGGPMTYRRRYNMTVS
jgi:hypothetical protein